MYEILHVWKYSAVPYIEYHNYAGNRMQRHVVFMWLGVGHRLWFSRFCARPVSCSVGGQMHLRKTKKKLPPKRETLEKIKATKEWQMENELYLLAVSIFNDIKARTIKSEVNALGEEIFVPKKKAFMYEKIVGPWSSMLPNLWSHFRWRLRSRPSVAIWFRSGANWCACDCTPPSM